MSTNTIDAELLAKMFLAGAQNLESKKEWINELNVFPVPDGDTGTNMSMTIESAATEVRALDHPDMKNLTKAMSSGSLRGARGNSGVILSQLLRGFSKGVRDSQNMDIPVLTDALQKATETAYRAVMKPKEGTILTVARAVSDKALELSESEDEIDMDSFIAACIAYGDEILDKTPDMLPVLKEAGVVDSGGQGLMQILKGAYDQFCGKDLVCEEQPVKKIEGYCTEFILEPGEPFTESLENEFYTYLEGAGEDAFLLADENIVKVHVHTLAPGEVISKALLFGDIAQVNIRHLRDGEKEKLITKADRLRAEEIKEQRKQKEIPRKEVGFIAVAAGEGLSSIFRDLGVDCVIEGGQTMNPSTDDMLKAIDKVNAQTVFIFPNNKNIILAASQAQTMVRDKKVIVIPTKTVPQGITAMINYVPEKSPSDNEEDMYQEIRRVKTCQLTYAVRDTHVGGKEICQGDYMGVGDSGILAVGKDLNQTAVEAVSQMLDEESELISVYYGADSSEEEGEKLCEQLRKVAPDAEVELNPGNQPVYYFIISVE